MRPNDILSPLLAAPSTVSYAGQRAVLASMHGKEVAIATPMAAIAQLAIEVPGAIDTDQLGTFTGEIGRPGSMLETAIAKARLGISLFQHPIGLASEGSYGPHPAAPMLAIGRELLVFVDDHRGLVISETLCDDAPVYEHVVVGAANDLSPFLIDVGFPSQGLIVRPHQAIEQPGHWHKGIRSRDQLNAALAASLAASSDECAFVQTDMRAAFNPRRMAMIARLARLLAARLVSFCPACRAPGFGVIARDAGLPCVDCGMPTNQVLSEIFGCAICEFRQPRARSDGLRGAAAANCLNCNP
jgi:hypothetical protein